MADFVASLRNLKVTPHVAQNTARRSAIDRRTTRRPGSRQPAQTQADRRGLRPALEPRDRSLVTVSALISAGKVEQMPFHLNKAMDNGLTRAETSAPA